MKLSVLLAALSAALVAGSPMSPRDHEDSLVGRAACLADNCYRGKCTQPVPVEPSGMD